MVYSQCPEPEPGKALESKGLHNFHITFLQGLGPIVLHCFHTGPVSCPGFGVKTPEVLQAKGNTLHCNKPHIIYHMKQEKPPKIYLLMSHMNNSCKFGIFNPCLKQCVVCLALYTLLHSHVFRAGESKVWCVVSFSTDQSARTDHPQHL